MTDVILRPAQKAWFDRIAGTIFPAHHCYLDTSETGSGKTIVALALAKHYSIPLFVVGPPTLCSQWRESTAHYDVELAEYISYQSLRGTKQAWLVKEDTPEHYAASPRLLRLCARGAFFVFDEWQNCANLTKQYYAARAVSAAALAHAPSYCALLSATPMVRESQIRQLLRFCGILLNPRLREGYKDLVEFHALVSRECPAVDRMPYLCREILPEFYSKIVRPFMVGGAVKDAPRSTRLHTANLFCSVSAGTVPLLTSAVSALSSAAKYDPETHLLRDASVSSSVLSMLAEVHKHMSEIFVTRALEVLDSPNTKVVIFTRFTKNLRLLYELLQDVTGVLVLDGSVPLKDRGGVVDDFTSDRMDNRILLSQIKVGGVGVNMQSRHPGIIVHGFCVPDWSFSDIEQASGRIYRAPYLNDAHFSIVYPSDAALAKILEAIAMSSSNVKQFVDPGVLACKTVLGDYPSFYVL